MLPSGLTDLAAQVLRHAEERGERVATAESCTGGLVAAALTAISGSSRVVDRGFVTYSNEAKAEMLGVPPDLIETHGAVSREVAVAMAEGALAHSRAHAAVAVTGIAGPGGGSADKPVGLVHFALARRGEATRHAEHRFDGDRDGIRLQAALAALGLFVPPQPT
ncbi:putative CinA (Competence-damage inducible protein) [Magnetospirillum sp. XM-1]|uniref:CinA family protein n=1 Tax=Magnetospirillum sp. XM-1 TaxID=1663591 RepID=UPI00073DDB39|nr:CinA family protein [Magnetospirillum sp. XM-1]CUW40374.1 putative CinA (Competence-damage inducible protein) [Magnetospirillum sp. XM-1]